MRNGNRECGVLVTHFLVVLILPMRNGNRECGVLVTHFLVVLILPMRNGNSLQEIIDILDDLRRFLSYL